MAKQPKSAIRFGCPQCQARLFARPEQAGTKRRCPRCQLVFLVPTAQEAAFRMEQKKATGEYTISDQPDSWDQKPANQITIVCPLCKTRMHASPDQIGQEMQCPDCDTRVTVELPSPETLPETPAFPVNKNEEYRLLGTDQPSLDVKEVYQTYIPVVCGLCHTRLLATEDQVGQKMVCPDCGTENVVPPLAKAAQPAFKLDTEATYRLSSTTDQASAGSGKRKPEFPVICGLCHTRMLATVDQVGKKVVCPDCGTETTVPEPPKSLPAIEPMEDTGADYSFTAPIRPPEFQPIFEVDWIDDPDKREEERAEPTRLHATQVAPNATALFFGVFGFLGHRGVLLRWLAFSAAEFVASCFLLTAIRFGALDNPVAVVFSMIFYVFAGLVAALCFTVLGATLVAVTVDTAAGNARIENWPEGSYVDWIYDVFYVINAGAVSFLAAFGAAWLLRGESLETDLSGAASLFILFPVLVLSMLERGSAMNPVSPLVWRSLIARFWAWGLFYLESGLLFAIASKLVFSSLVLMGPAGLMLALPLGTATLLVYFRLLGRLALVCGQGTPCKSTEEQSG